MIEKHVTIDRRMKGTDHAASLGPDGINRMIRDIRLLEMSLGIEDIFIEPSVLENKTKLERSIAANRDLEIGYVITEKDICLLSPGDGIPWDEKDKVIGKKVIIPIKKHEIIYPRFISEL